MAKTHLISARDIDLVAFYGRMRPTDQLELSGPLPKGREQAIHHLELAAAQAREAHCVTVDGVPAILFGCWTQAFVTDTAHPWAFVAADMAQHWRIFVYGAKQYVAHLNEEYRVLRNFVRSDNHTALRWLRTLGFVVSRDTYVSPDGIAYSTYERVRK